MPPANGIHVPQPGIKWPRPAGRLPGVADSHSQGDLSSDQSNMREGSSQVNSKSFWIVHLCPRSKPEWTTTATAALATHSPAVSLAPGWPSAVSQTAGRRWRQQGQHLDEDGERTQVPHMPWGNLVDVLLQKAGRLQKPFICTHSVSSTIAFGSVQWHRSHQNAK